QLFFRLFGTPRKVCLMKHGRGISPVDLDLSFGILRRKVATFEEPVKRPSAKNPGFIELFWKATLPSSGRVPARPRKRSRPSTISLLSRIPSLPRYLLVCDFQTF